jgi:hypothetical protein
MQRLEVSVAVRHIYIYIYIYVVRRLRVNGSKTTKNGVIKLLMNIFHYIMNSTKYGNVSKQNCVIHQQSF